MYTWLVYVSDMEHSFAWHESFACDLKHSHVTYIYVIRLIQACQDSFICDMTHPHGTWLIRTWHDSFMCDSMHSYVTCDMIHYMWHDSSITNCVSNGVGLWFMCVTWLSHMWHDSCICDMTLTSRTAFHTALDLGVMHVCDMTRPCVTWLTHV